MNSRYVIRRTTTIGEWQCGQRQLGSGLDEAAFADVFDGEAESNSLHNKSRAVRKRLARNTKWRMRTKPLGKTCKKKRRRNSIAVSVVLRHSGRPEGVKRIEEKSLIWLSTTKPQSLESNGLRSTTNGVKNASNIWFAQCWLHVSTVEADGAGGPPSTQ